MDWLYKIYNCNITCIFESIHEWAHTYKALFHAVQLGEKQIWCWSFMFDLSLYKLSLSSIGIELNRQLGSEFSIYNNGMVMPVKYKGILIIIFDNFGNDLCSSVVEHWSSNLEDVEFHFSQLVPIWVL